VGSRNETSSPGGGLRVADRVSVGASEGRKVKKIELSENTGHLEFAKQGRNVALRINLLV
jgi:hypothetical protein